MGLLRGMGEGGEGDDGALGGAGEGDNGGGGGGGAGRGNGSAAEDAYREWMHPATAPEVSSLPVSPEAEEIVAALSAHEIVKARVLMMAATRAARAGLVSLYFSSRPEAEDMQGINWAGLGINQPAWRLNRIRTHESYRNTRLPCCNRSKILMPSFQRGSLLLPLAPVRHGEHPAVQQNLTHFQLRHLLRATSKHEVVCSLSDSLVAKWDAIARRATPIFTLPQGQVTTLDARGGLTAAGGMTGGFAVARDGAADPGGMMLTGTITDNAIVNSVELSFSRSGAARVMAACNDSCIRVLDLEDARRSESGAIACHTVWPFATPVNHCSSSPDRSLVVAGLDSVFNSLFSAETGVEVARLIGHSDYTFCSAWHPNGTFFATGNQDGTANLYDLRKLSRPVLTIDAIMSAVRSLQFSPDGTLLAMSEGSDLVHLYDTRSGYRSGEIIDMFGDISGISFDPDSSHFFVANSHPDHGGLFSFALKRDAWDQREDLLSKV
jgi:hypothetical protein